MPHRYEAIRDSLLKRGVPLQRAKSEAAATYNATRKKGEPSLAEYVRKERGKG